MPPKYPIYRNAQWNPSAVDHIAVLPVFDARMDKSEQIDFDKRIWERTVTHLNNKGYGAQKTTTPGFFRVQHLDQLNRITPEQVRQMGPQSYRWIFFVALIDAKSEIGFGSFGNAEVKGYLFDKNVGQPVWFDKGVGQAGQGGLAGMMLKGLVMIDAMNNTVSDLFKTFPSRAQSY